MCKVDGCFVHQLGDQPTTPVVTLKRSIPISASVALRLLAVERGSGVHDATPWHSAFDEVVALLVPQVGLDCLG